MLFRSCPLQWVGCFQRFRHSCRRHQLRHHLLQPPVRRFVDLPQVRKKRFRQDHLIPEDIAKKVGRLDLLTDYNNLVYSCRVCNRNKWNNWPFDNVDKIHDDKVGFVDPATDEFDEHMMRDETGRIVPKTQVGNYMYKIFNFSNRLTEVWWKLSVISKEINEIDNILEKEETVDGLKQYWRLHRQFDSFIESLKEANESI